MARRRLAGALGAGLGAGLSSIGENISDLAMKRYESGLVQERQAELSKQNQAQQLMVKALADPAFAQKLIQSGLAKKMGLDIPAPTSNDLQAPLMKQIVGAQKETDIPTSEEMAASDQSAGGQFTTNPSALTGGQIPIGIKDILARQRAAQAKRAEFTRVKQEAPVTLEYPNAQGQMMKEYSTQGEAQGMALPSEASPTQKASAAGRSSFAQTANSEAARHTPAAIQGEGARAAAIAAAQEGAKSQGGMTPSMQAGVSRLTSAIKMLKDLDPNLTKQTGVGGRVEGLAQQFGARITGEDSPAVVYDAISSALLPALARSSGEVGNLAEQEQVRYERLAPKVSDPINVRMAKYAAIQYLIDSANAGKTADQMRPFLDYLQFAQGGSGALRNRLRQELGGTQ